MIREITGACFESGKAQIRIIETREDAHRNETFFFQLTNLYRQLTDRTPARNMMQLVGPHLHFAFITDGTNLVASATLVVVRTAIRCKGFVEDVVVDQKYRNGGLGKILVDEIITLGRLRGCQCLQLTSKPERAGTGCFYPKLGFEQLAIARTDHPDGTSFYRYEY
jgi:phosphinothricin acetyltransferase